MNIKAYKQTVKTFIEAKKAAACSPETLNSYTNTLNSYGRFAERKKADPAAPATIAAWKIELNSRGLAAASIRLYITHLQLFFRFAVEIEAVPKNPCTAEVCRMARQHGAKPYEHVLNKAAVMRLLSAPEADYKGVTRRLRARNKAMLTLLLTTGLRNSELRTLPASALDFENCTITVEHGKGDKYRVVSFPLAARDAVEKYLNSGVRPAKIGQEQPLFGSVNSKGKWQAFTRPALSALIERTVRVLTGVEGIRTHALRHAYASMLLAGGVDKHDIQDLLGHSSVTTTERYIERLSPAKPAEIANEVFAFAAEMA